MSQWSILHAGQDSGLTALLDRQEIDASSMGLDLKIARRRKLWDLSSNLHCSIIGTCLTPAELRQVFVKLREPDARTATDHALHGHGVRAAGRHDLAGKLLHKTLDARHETTVKRFAKGAPAAEVGGLWRQALEQGAIPGAYWAVLTHPATDHALVQEVFGDVHMLSHRIGASNRTDIARLRRLEDEIGERDDKIARQEERLRAASRDRDALLRKIGDLEAAIVRLGAVAQAKSAAPAGEAETGRLLNRLAEEKAHASAQAERLAITEEKARKADALAAELNERNSRLERELAILEDTLSREDGRAARSDAITGTLRGLRILYVGGRPKLIDQLKGIAAQQDGLLLTHDGGLEDSAATLPGLVSQADRVFFPVDCVSHDAAGKVKKLCRRLGKPYVPLRTASLAAFLAALAISDRGV